MLWLVWFLLFCAVSSLVFFRLLAWVIVWYAWSKMKAKVTVGSVGFFAFRNIVILDRKGNRITIESIWCSSSLVNQEVQKTVCFCLNGVHLFKNTEQSSSKQTPNSDKTDADKIPKTPKISSTLILILQHVGLTISELEIHMKTQLLQWDLILTNLRCNLSQCDHMSNLELGITNVTLHGRDMEYRLIFVLSFMLNLNVLLQKYDQRKSGSLIQNLDLKIQFPRGFMKEETLTLLAEQRTLEEDEIQQPRPKRGRKLNYQAFIPLSANFEIRDSSFSLSRYDDCRNLTLMCQKLGANVVQRQGSFQTSPELVGISLDAQINVFSVHGVKGRIMHLENVSFATKTDQQSITSSLKVRQPNFDYQHYEILYWLTVFRSLEPDRKIEVVEISSEPKKESFVQRYISTRSISLILDITEVKTGIPLDDGGFTGGLRYCKFRLDLRPCEGKPGLKHRNLNCDIILDTLFCQLGDGEPKSDRNRHEWGTVFYLGTFSSKIEKMKNIVGMETMIDSVQMEWSTQAVETMVSILRATRIRALSSPLDDDDLEKIPLVPKSRDRSEHYDITLTGKITNINLFIANNFKHFLMLRVDSITSDKDQDSIIVHVSSCKLVFSRLRQSYYQVVQSLDVIDFIGFILEVKNIVNTSLCEVSTSIMHDVHFKWTTGFQMMLYQMQQDVKSLKNGFQEYRGPKRGRRISGIKEMKKAPNFGFELSVLGSVTLAAQLSRDHSITVDFNQSQVVMDSTRNMELSIQMITIDFDDQEIFLMQEVCISSSDESEDFDAERQSFENLETKTNRAWLVSLDRLGIVFPFLYKFSLCWARMMQIKKFLKKLHSDPSKKSSGRLPPDLGFRIKVLHIQIDDDPFEVKLGDNYALLVDEHREGEKRISAMDRRINELRKKHGLLPTGKVEELYASLHQKNSTIYVKRSQQQYQEHPMRSALFQWKMEDLEIFLLADETLLGKEKCVKNMKEIDKESPYPENLEFNTLFGRMLNSSVAFWTVQLRDYTQPMLDIQDMHMWGRLIVAEPMGTTRARYTVTVEVPDPWDDVEIQKNMPNPKFYHDMSCDVNSFVMAYGACWEPCMAQYNRAMDNINKPSIDPSRPMPFWDKIRLLYHGRLTLSTQQMSWLYHTSLDPFNSTEFMDWTWTNLVLDWTNGKFILKGDLDIYLRTASKYDDCRFFHLPHLTFGVGIDWLCHGDKNDHHSVMPCHPDKVPEFSLEAHDSYRAFRSQKWNLSLNLETRRCQDEEGFEDMPCCLFYSSTARFLEKIKMCIARVSRPIKRGTYYNTQKPRKVALSRHYKNVSVNLKFTNPFLVCYWASFAKQHGLEMAGNSFTLDAVFRQDLVPQEGPLRRRQIVSWSVVRLGMDLDRAQTWVCSTSQDDEADEANTSMRSPIIRSFFFSIQKLRYSRDEKSEHHERSLNDEEKPVHQVDINNLKGAWTKRNRNIMIKMYDGYSNAAALRRAISSDALKGFKKVEGTNTPMKRPHLNTSLSSLQTPSPLSRLQSGHAFSLLQKLVSESDSKFVAFAEEPSVGNMEQLHGVAACQTGDVIKRNWAIDLHNSQVIMRGIETAGYVIVSASRAQILSCEHRAVWHDQQLKTKTTWVGNLECMQYYSTVSKQLDDDMYWLTEDNVVLNSDDSASRIPEMVGCGQSVGGVVTKTVDTEGNIYDDVVQLQRIISRCKLQFFYASYGEADPNTLSEVPTIPDQSPNDLERSFDEGVDSLTLLHHDLNICTNSIQYHIMLDIVNNLLLYVEPKKKIYTDKLQAMRFKLELSSIDDQRTPILALQEKLRQNILTMRSVERELYMTHRHLDDNPMSVGLIENSDKLEKRLYEMKEQISNDGEDLGIMISGFIARQLEIETRQKHTRKTTPTLVSRRNEVCFKHAQWRLTEMDGQIGVCDVMLRNFMYVKTNNNDDSGSHLVELGWAKMQNLLANSIYKDVLMPQDIGKGKLDDVALRIVCRVKPPVGGISVKEHLEINLVPVQIQITNQFYRAMMEFFFPGEAPDDADDTASVVSVESSATTTTATSSKEDAKSSKDDAKSTKEEAKSSFRSYVDLPDEIDKMKERAARNNTFLHVKIPELPLRISYKGEREKNVTDVHDMLIRLPPFEIHNQTWTWFDLLMAVKNSSKRALLSQAIKQKLHLRRLGDETVTDVQLEEDKAKMLLGAKLVSGSAEKLTSSSKKSLFGKSKMK